MTGQDSVDPYAVLGVPRDATQALIDQAYRALVRRYHPDSRTIATPPERWPTTAGFAT